jgi:hypothetical protein
MIVQGDYDNAVPRENIRFKQEQPQAAEALAQAKPGERFNHISVSHRFSSFLPHFIASGYC